MAKGRGDETADKEEDLGNQLETVVLANIRALRNALASCQARVLELEAQKAAAAADGEVWNGNEGVTSAETASIRPSSMAIARRTLTTQLSGRSSVSGKRPSLTDIMMDQEKEHSYVGSYGKLVHFLKASHSCGELDDAEAEELMGAVEDISRFSSGRRCSVEQALFKNTSASDLNQLLPSMGIQVHSDGGPSWGAMKSDRPPPKIVKREFDRTNEKCLNDSGFNCRTRGDVATDASLIRFAYESPFNLLERYSIDSDRLDAWVETIANQYNESCPYHNWMHALDVFHFCYLMLVPGKVGNLLTSLELLALMTATVGHDVGHPGYNNAFIVNTSHDIAIRYNDNSPLENMHASTCFQVLLKPELNFLESMSQEDYKAFRSHVIECILATDMAHHFALVDRFSARVCSKEGPFKLDEGKDDKAMASKEDQLMLMQAITHMADLGHCCRPWNVHKHMVVALEQEFFAQGDQERTRGMPVMPMMDRQKDSAAASQNFFLSKMVCPLLESFQVFSAPAIADLFKNNLNFNAKTWDGLIATHGKQTAFKLIQVEDPEGSAAEERKRLAIAEKRSMTDMRSLSLERHGLKSSSRSPRLTPPTRAQRSFEY